MPAYLLPADHGPALRDGRQRITLAATRSPQNQARASSAHAAVGDTVQLDLAPSRGRKRTRVDQGTCILRACVVISDIALVRIMDLRFRDTGDHVAAAERIARILQQAEQGVAGGGQAEDLARLAKLAGFRSWKSLWAWNSHRDRRGCPDDQGRVTREVIGWA